MIRPKSMSPPATFIDASISRRSALKLAAASAVAMLAGCGRSSSGSGKIALTQWYHEYGQEGTQEAAIRYAQEYMKLNPHVEVKVVWIPGDYTSKLATALLTDQGPDVFEGGLTLPMLKAGQVAPLDELYTDDIRKDFHPRDLAANSANGHIYGVTMIDDTGLLYCRRSMLDAAGVKPPTTMDELIQTAKRLTTRNTKGLFVGNDGGVAALMYLVPWSAGSDFLVDNKIVFDNPRTVAAYQKIAELNASGALLIGAPTDWLDFNAFTEGMCAMQWTGLWAYPDIKQRLGDDVVAVAWPAFDAAGSPVTFSGGWSAMVNARSRHLADAKRYVQWQWIQSAHIQKDWCVGYGFHIPPRRSVEAVTEPFKSGIPAVAAANFEKYGRILPPAWSNAMTTALSDALANILKKGRPAAAEVSAAAAKCTEELKQLLA